MWEVVKPTGIATGGGVAPILIGTGSGICAKLGTIFGGRGSVIEETA